VFRRNNAGNTEINIPKTITSKAEAVRWLKAHPNKVAKPNRYRGKRTNRPMAVYHKAYNPFNTGLVNMRTSPNNFFKYESPKYAGVPSPAKANTPKTNLSASNFRKSLRNIESIGSGRQGRAYVVRQGKARFVLKVSPYDGLTKKRGEPQPGDIEYEINTKCMKAAPNGVVRVYSHIHALDFVPARNLKNVPNLDKPHFNLSKQNIIVMELCDGGSLDAWLKKNSPTDETMHQIIKQILTTLRKIQDKYPYFRHNDLHIENIFVSRKRGFLMADFGWARLEEKGTNPAVNTANGTATASHYGVGPKTDARYDQHLFLNQLRDIVLRTPSKFPKTLAFLNKAVPFGYRGKDDTHVNDFRLKYEDPCPGLPSLDALFKLPYLRTKFVSSPQLAGAKGRLRKTGRVMTPPRNLSVRTKKVLRAPSPNKAYTNAELVALTRNQLFKLSPKTRVRAIALRAKTKGPSPPKKKAKTPSPVRANKRPAVSQVILKSAKFEKLIEKIWRNAGNLTNNGWTSARNKALNIVRMKGLSLSPVAPVARPHGVVKLAALEHVRSPTSGRYKIRAPNSGRLVYADGASVPLKYLKNLAHMVKANIKGLRSKTQIANKIFSNRK
jgi:serine/threonine protein kinase